MDIASVIGIVAGVSLVAITILMGGTPFIFWDASSLILVIGGTLAVTLLNFPLADVLGVLNTLRYAFTHNETPPERIIEQLVGFAAIARREGVLALETHAEIVEDEFLKRSVMLAIDGASPELIKDVLTTEISFLEERHTLGQSILVAMGTYAPAFGMIGTLLGLVQMLVSLDNPSQIGSGMAVAILTTLYGALIANVFCLPAAGKLRVRTAKELLTKEIVIEGILSIQSGDHPRIVEQKLKAFVSPATRARVRSI